MSDFLCPLQVKEVEETECNLQYVQKKDSSINSTNPNPKSIVCFKAENGCPENGKYTTGSTSVQPTIQGRGITEII